MDKGQEELLIKLLETQYKVFKEHYAKLNRLEKNMFIHFAILVIFLLCLGALTFSVWWLL
jgi:hypothetical protein